MTATLAEVLTVIEAFVPVHLAEDWDNVGLQAGQRDWPVDTVWVALDPLPDVVSAACLAGANLLVTHHPLVFRPLHAIDFGTPIGSIIQMAAANRLAIYCMHTNLDSAAEGTNKVLADRIGLKNPVVLRPRPESPDVRILAPSERARGVGQGVGHGMGRVGELARPMKLFRFAESVKNNLGIETVKVAGRAELLVKKAALCSGSGGGLLQDFISSGAQVYISGDFRYHDARVVEAEDLGLIDIGHFQSEHLIVDVLARQLREVLRRAKIDADVVACRLEKDPFKIV